jgi:hypothetical protein
VAPVTIAIPAVAVATAAVAVLRPPCVIWPNRPAAQRSQPFIPIQVILLFFRGCSFGLPSDNCHRKCGCSPLALFLFFGLLLVSCRNFVAVQCSVINHPQACPLAFVNQMKIICNLEVETSPNRSSYPGGTHGYPHAYNGDRVSKSPSPSAHYRSTSKRDSGHTKSRREDGLHTTVTTRSRSPPVVTIAPTLSLSGLHYQDSRKVE